MIPQDTKEEPKTPQRIENGDNNIKKQVKIKQNIKSYKRYPTRSDKNLPIFSSQTFAKIRDKINPSNDISNTNDRNIIS